MFSSVPMIAYGIQPYNFEIIKIIILTILTLYSGFFASLIWNDITDADIDAIAHPDRPIPSGKINKKKFFRIALIFSLLTFIFAILINIWCFILVGITALFVFFHNKYLKRSVKFPAYSEIFSPLQWIVVVIFGFFAVWTNFPNSYEIFFNIHIFGKISANIKQVYLMFILIIFTYFADNSHDIIEGIHDAKADMKFKVKTYATTFGLKKAVIISFCMFFISAIFAILFFIHSFLSPIFLCLFLILFIYTLFYELKFFILNFKKIDEYGKFVGRKLYNYFLFFYNIIFLDLIIQLLNLNFL
jgi:geranylgeranylglycerol-phosphate geranylgeranyltransferase